MLPLATDLPKITQMLRLALHSTGSRFLDRQRQNKKADVSRRELRPGNVVKRAQGEEEEPGQQKKRGLASARLQQHPRQQSSEASSAWGSSPNQRPATNTSRVCAAPNGFTLLAKIPSAVRLMADGVSRATLPFPVPVCLNSDSEDSSRLLGVLYAVRTVTPICLYLLKSRTCTLRRGQLFTCGSGSSLYGDLLSAVVASPLAMRIRPRHIERLNTWSQSPRVISCTAYESSLHKLMYMVMHW